MAEKNINRHGMDVLVARQTLVPGQQTLRLLLAGLSISVLCGSAFVISGTAMQTTTIQGAEGARPMIRLQFQLSPSYQMESEQQLKRAVVVAKTRKTNVGTLFGAYLLLTNVAADNCDLSKPALTSDSDFALVALISEKFKEKEGPEGTAIHRILFGALDQSQPRYLFIAAPANPERLHGFVGDVPYHVEPAWPIGWGSRWAVTMIPKGMEKVVPVEVRLEESNSGWIFLLHHLAAKKQWQNIDPKPETYLVLSRDATGPTVRFQHLGKKVSVAGNVPLTVCGMIPEDAPIPFGPGQ